MAQTVTCGTGTIVARQRPGACCVHMLLIIGALITATATVSILCIRASGVNADHLGWMSEQWLAEHRASQAH